MWSMSLILLVMFGCAVGAVVLVRHFSMNAPRPAVQSKTTCACECCHNSAEVERPVV